MTVDGGRWIHFEAGSTRLAVSLAEIAEVTEVGRVDPVPLAPAVIAGLADLRGRVVTLVDAAALIGPTTTVDRAHGSEAIPRVRAPGAGPRLAIVFAEPLAHLGLLIDGEAHMIDSDSGKGIGETQTGTGPATAGAPEGRLEGIDVVLSDGRPARLIAAREVAEACARHVRARFRVAPAPETAARDTERS